MSGDIVLLRLDRARQALSEAKTIQETKRITDIAGAAEIYAKRQGMSQEAIDYAHSIRIEALRRLGEILDATKAERAKGTRGRIVRGGRGRIAPPGGAETGPPGDDAPTLADLGLDKKTSSVAQKLAALPQKQFEQVRSGTATVSQAIHHVIETKAKAVTKRRLRSETNGSPILEAIKEAKQWIVRWGHISALAPICDAITMISESISEGNGVKK